MKIEFIDLHVSVDKKKVLDGISLAINAGEIHALMGPNGSGKSTLSLVLAGHPKYKVEQGDIKIDGKSIIALSPSERAKLGLFLSFQNPPEVQGVGFFKFLFALAKQKEPQLSALEFKKRLEEQLHNIGVDRQFAERELNVGFSGGEKKRAEVLQLLTLKPSFAILDELDSGLDVDSLRILSSAITQLRGQNFSALIVTHYPRILEHIKPDFVHILQDGKLVASGDFRLAKKVELEGYVLAK